MRLREYQLPWLFAALVAVAAGVGGTAAYTLGRAMLVRSAETRLEHKAEALEDHTEELGKETDILLTQASQSQYPFCSPSDIAFLRELAFESRYVKDVGRLRDGKFYCSGSLGVLSTPTPTQAATVVTPDDRRITVGTPVSVSPTMHATVMARGTANLVLSSDAFLDDSEPPIRSVMEVIDMPHHKVLYSFSDLLPVTPDIVFQGHGEVRNGVIYSPICSPDLPICIVSAMRVTDAWNSNPTLLVGFAIAGGLAGCGFGLAMLIFYRRRQTLDKQLWRAVQRGQITVAYQPIVNLETRAIIGAEALARWTDEDGQSVAPDIFIGMAERGGFVHEITRAVMRQTIDHFLEVFHKDPEFTVLVNIAASDLQHHALFEQMEAHILHAGIRPAAISVELTERSTADREVALKGIALLRECGHKVYIDDFGTGYSSLGYLHELQVDGIKIDRSFTSTVGTEAITASIVPQILAMAETLHLNIIAEGIETESQAAYFLKTGSGRLAQGWLFGKPMTADAFKTMLRARARISGQHTAADAAQS